MEDDKTDRCRNLSKRTLKLVYTRVNYKIFNIYRAIAGGCVVQSLFKRNKNILSVIALSAAVLCTGANQSEASTIQTGVINSFNQCSDVIGRVFMDNNEDGIFNKGDEGIGSTRIQTTSGLSIYTDSEGLYHIPCATVPNMYRGGNVILKVDEASLPTGTYVFTSNPVWVKATSGILARASFAVIKEQKRQILLEIEEGLFEDKGEVNDTIESLVDVLSEKESELLVILNTSSEDEGGLKLQGLISGIEKAWQEKGKDYSLEINGELK